MRHKIICGHVLDVLNEMPSESVDCIVTSPPYWSLRDYGKETNAIWGGDENCEHEWRNAFCKKCGAWYGQLGLEPTLDMYIDHMLQITAELKRVLKKTGVMFWNHGDNYSTLGNKMSNYEEWAKRNAYGSAVIKTKIPQKCMCLQNYRLILRMIDEQGWMLRNIIVWNKPNHMPSSVKDRFANAYEPVFMLVKNNEPIYYYNTKTGLMIDKKPPGLKGKEGVDWDYDKRLVWDEEIESYKEVLQYDDEGNPKKISHWKSLSYWFDLDAVRVPSKLTPKEAESKRNKNFSKFRGDNSTYIERGLKSIIEGGNLLHPLGKNPSDVWEIPAQSFSEAHFATFPEKLVEPMIKAGCPQWICKKCGHARVRIVETEYSWQTKSKTKGEKQSSGQMATILGHALAEHYTIGWTDCGCNAGWASGVVLDPFGGAGTTAVVAEKLGRNSIIIDLNPEYCEMAYKRLKPLVAQTKLTGESSKIERIGFLGSSIKREVLVNRVMSTHKKLKALDLFCGAGGSSYGLKKAGFDEVAGVDINPQPDYPFEFIQADVFKLDIEFLRQFDLIWASPPCQAYSFASAKWRNKGKKYLDLVGKTRELLLKAGKPFVIENVVQAPIRKDLMLCGTMFNLRVLKHRYFEIHGFKVPQPSHPKHEGTVKDGTYVTVAGHGGNGKASIKIWQEACGNFWINDRKMLAESIPWKYAEYIGKYFKRIEF